MTWAYSRTVSPGAVLGEGMDVGIVPKTGGFNTVGAQHLNALVGTGRTAGM